jgi:hypothetical protein
MERQLLFREKVPKSNTNTVITIPNLTYQGLILSQIDFQSEQWFFEVSIKCGANDLVRLGNTYFQHSHSLDLSGFRSRIEDGDKLEMYLKPKQAPKDLDLMICYTYVPSKGSIYHQSSERLCELGSSSNIISDISQSARPTFLHIRCDVEITQISVVPRFTDPSDSSSDDSENEVHLKFNGTENKVYDIDFTRPEFTKIMPLLKYYQLVVKGNSNADAMIHFMARGYKI